MSEPERNLVLVHSFGTNSTVLSGLDEFLEDYFDVYMIDLPGFHREKAPLSTISLDRYSRYLEEELASLDIDSYMLGGISFGFLVINHMEINENHCDGIMALEPFINADSLNMSAFEERIYQLCLNSITFLELGSLVWNNALFRTGIKTLTTYPNQILEKVLNHYDGRTFFQTAALLMSYSQDVTFHKDLPYILAINTDDTTLDSSTVEDIFTERIEDLMVIHMSVDHYPDDISKDYFASHIPKDRIRAISGFVQEH